MLLLEKFSLGVGDRFAHQAKAQLRACQLLAADGAVVVPVWNKSNREHSFIGSEPASVLTAAQAAVAALGWEKGWHVDADHIRLETVDRFIPHSDFFTLDVADSIGQPAAPDDLRAFVDRHPELIGTIEIPDIETPFQTTREEIERIAAKFLLAVQDAGKIYRHVAIQKGADRMIAEVSMDETDSPQTPPELLVILAAIADEGIPAQTIAPKFTGRFNKGVDYVGDLAQFEREFHDDLAVIAFAIERYGLPTSLKLSVHSGSDKFSIYPIIRRTLPKFGAGLHLKTAGTTWLEELIGLAEAGGEALGLAKEIYATAIEHVDELTAPYATVIDIDRAKLPSASEVAGWTSGQYTGALRHDQAHPLFNASFRQLLHVSFKLAAKQGRRYLDLIEANEEIVGRNVTEPALFRVMRSAITISLVPQAKGGPFVFWDGLADGCERAAALGFDAVEIFSPDAGAINQWELASLLSRHSLRVAAFGTGGGWVAHKLTLTHADPAIRARARAFIGEIIDLAGTFDAPAIIGSMQGRWEGEVSRDQATAWLAEALEELGDRGASHGQVLLYEPLNRYETNLFNRVADTADFLDTLRTRSVKILADLFHMNIEEACIADALRAGARHLGHVHFADSNRRAIGLGHTDAAPVVAALREIGYDGYLSGEILPLPDSDTAAQQTIESFRRFTQS